MRLPTFPIELAWRNWGIGLAKRAGFQSSTHRLLRGNGRCAVLHGLVLVGMMATTWTASSCMASGGVGASNERSLDHGAGKKVALVIGVHHYDLSQRLGPLPLAEADASVLAGVLDRAGYTVTLMTQKEALQRNLPRRSPQFNFIEARLKEILEDPTLTAEDTVIISLAGHGIKLDRVSETGERTPEFFFCASDAQLVKGDVLDEDLDRANQVDEGCRLVALKELYLRLERCKAGTKLLLVDACRSDPGQEVRSRAESSTFPELPPPPGGVLVFNSCSPFERAWEAKRLGHGVFFHYVIQGLAGEADRGNRTRAPDGIITVAELQAFVSESVRDYLQQEEELYGGASQTPELVGISRGEVALIDLSQMRPEPLKAGVNSIGIKLVPIDAGVFLMGAPKNQPGFHDIEIQHEVALSHPFMVGQHEITVEQFGRFVYATQYVTDAERFHTGVGYDPRSRGTTVDEKFSWRYPGFPQEENHPVVNVSWRDAIEFCNWLSRREHLPEYYEINGDRIERGTGPGYRLPTEAEWEYACRAGTRSAFWFGNRPELFFRFGNLADQSHGPYFDGVDPLQVNDRFPFTSPVGSFRQNPWGLYDTLGNVHELCWDRAVDYVSGRPLEDSTITGTIHIKRDGCFKFNPDCCRSAHRGLIGERDPDLCTGFRVVRGRE